MFSRSLALVFLPLLTACAPQEEASPLADAGAAHTGQIGQPFTFSAGVSGAVTWSWSLIEAPPGSALGPDALAEAQTPWPSFVPDAAGVYTLELVACDAEGWCALDWTEAYVGVEGREGVDEDEVRRLQDDPDPLDFRPGLIRKGGSWSPKWGSGERLPLARPGSKLGQ